MTTAVAEQTSAPSAAGKQPPAGRKWRQRLALTSFLGPGLLFYLMFMIIPLLGTIFLSFTNWSGVSFSDIHLTGVSNYKALAHDPVFREALVHTLVFVIVAAALKTTVALVAALALNLRLRLSGTFRMIFVMPTVISAVVIGAVFTLALSPSLGAVNPALSDIGLGRFTGDWLGSTSRALPVVIVLDVWQNFGIYMLIYISRLLAIPEDLGEAARIDGASRWQETWRITIPLLRSTTGVVLLLACIDSLKVFTTVYIMTRGGPNHATEVLSTWAYSEAFNQDEVGYGSAILVVLLAIAFAFALIWFKLFRKSED
jgi:raffinose/stachyose/melibiose transport system permease protein